MQPFTTVVVYQCCCYRSTQVYLRRNWNCPV